MFGYESFDRAALPGLFGLKPLRPGTPQPKSFVFLYGGFSGQTAFSGNNFDFGTSIEDKKTIKWISGSITIKRTATFKMIAREYHNQKKYEGVPKLKRIPGSITIKMTAREYSKIVLSGIIIRKTTAMEHSN